MGWLVCCTSGDAGRRGPRARPARARRDCARPSSGPRPRSSATPGSRFLHQPDGALANDLPCASCLVREIRTFRPDAVLSHGPGGRRSTATAASTTPTTAPRGSRPSTRSTRPRATRWPSRGSPATGSRRTSRPAALPVLDEPPERLGRRHRRRSAARSTRCAPTPARSSDPERPRPADRASGPQGATASRSGVAAAEAFRLVDHRRRRGRGPERRRRGRSGRGDAERLSSAQERGRTRPQAFHEVGQALGAAARAASTISPSVRSPAAVRQVVVGRRPRPRGSSSAISRLGRPVPDAHRVEPGVADRQRQVALARDPPVERSRPSRRSGSRTRPARVAMSRACASLNSAQNGWSPGNSSADASIARARIASIRPLTIAASAAGRRRQLRPGP